MFDDLDPRAGPAILRHPASDWRLSAMASIILRAIGGREADREWEDYLIDSIRGLGDDDRWRLQVALDKQAGRAGGGEWEPGGAGD